MEAEIRLEDVTLGYEGNPVLEAVLLRIPKGIFLPFIGPNGAGKTTLLRAILGFVPPLRGIIRTPFDNHPAGYVPQHKSIDVLFPVTVRDIVGMGLYRELGWWKKRDKKQREQVQNILSELGLEKDADKNFRDLSGGMKQKTLIGRALISGADFFVMDEPTSELDERTENEIFKHLKNFVLEKGKTVLVAYHGLHRVLSEGFAKELCVVNHGRVQRVDLKAFRPEMI